VSIGLLGLGISVMQGQVVQTSDKIY
jgi:hypothetical protein